MSVDVTIKQKGLIKKALDWNFIIGDKLSYGTMGNDGLRLNPGECEGNELIVYSTDHIGRGIGITLASNKKDYVELRLMIPSNPDEVETFFDIVLRITDFWNCSLGVDGNIHTPKQFAERLPEIKEFSANMAKKVLEKVLEEKTCTTLFSAMWPLHIGVEEAQQYSGNLEEFYNWMHEKQNEDAYYALPNFYVINGRIEGKYVITEGVRSIIAYKPSVPFGVVDNQTGKAVECDNWEVCLYSYTEDKMLGTMAFDKFVGIMEQKAKRFDGETMIFDGLSVDEMKEMI